LISNTGAKKKNIIRKERSWIIELSLAAQWLAKEESISRDLLRSCDSGETKHLISFDDAVAHGITNVKPEI